VGDAVGKVVLAPFRGRKNRRGPAVSQGMLITHWARKEKVIIGTLGGPILSGKKQKKKADGAREKLAKKI